MLIVGLHTFCVLNRTNLDTPIHYEGEYSVRVVYTSTRLCNRGTVTWIQDNRIRIDCSAETTYGRVIYTTYDNVILQQL